MSKRSQDASRQTNLKHWHMADYQKFIESGIELVSIGEKLLMFQCIKNGEIANLKEILDEIRADFPNFDFSRITMPWNKVGGAAHDRGPAKLIEFAAFHERNAIIKLLKAYIIEKSEQGEGDTCIEIQGAIGKSKGKNVLAGEDLIVKVKGLEVKLEVVHACYEDDITVDLSGQASQTIEAKELS